MAHRLARLAGHVLAAPCAEETAYTAAPWEGDDDGALSGAVAIVTGASQGVGKGIATALAKAGATVYMTGRYEDTIAAAAADVEAAAGGRGRAVGVASDAASDDATRALFARVVQAHDGRLDVLVNNVTMNLSHLGERNTHGAADSANPDEPPPWWVRDTVEEWDVTNTVGLRSYFLAASLAAPLMASQGSGLIVNISSFGGVRQYIGVPHGVVKTATDRTVPPPLFTHPPATAGRPFFRVPLT